MCHTTTCYLIHFNQPYRHARHYIGSALNLEARLSHHRSGTGARLIAVIQQAGIDWQVVRTWEGDKQFERNERPPQRKETLPHLYTTQKGIQAMNPQPPTITQPPNGAKPAPVPHCTICGQALPNHKPDCKHNPAKRAPAPQPAPTSPAPKSDAPRITWSGIATTLKAAHLQGKPRTLTIRAVRMEETMPQPGKPKQTPVLYFKEQPQKFILGEGNQTALMTLFGDDAGACIGKQITIAPVRWGKKEICRIVTGATFGEPPF